MSTYVLAHGAWHGAWCWHKVVPRLEAAGHDVVTVDLPGHGTDTTPIGEVTLDACVERVGSALREQREPVILVGHSMGGVVIEGASARYPEEIETAVYLTAFLLEKGTTLLEVTQADEDSAVLANTDVDEDAGTATIREGAVELFYHDCSPADLALCRSLLGPEALALFTTPVETSDGEFGANDGFDGVTRVYIECLEDRAISPGVQEEMYTTLPCEEVLSLDTSHSPFLSAPDELTDHLTSLSSS